MADQLITGTTIIEDVRGERGKVWSAPGSQFVARTQAGNIDPRNGTFLYSTDGEATPTCHVNLPHGATVNKVIVYGSETDIIWTLHRLTLSTGASETMATANHNTEDTTISNNTVDNNNFAYYFQSGIMNITDKIYGAKITYD